MTYTGDAARKIAKFQDVAFTWNAWVSKREVVIDWDDVYDSYCQEVARAPLTWLDKQQALLNAILELAVTE